MQLINQSPHEQRQSRPESNSRSIKSRLALATYSLLSATPALAGGNDPHAPPLEVSLSSMIYSEDARVLVNEDVLQVKNEIDDEEFLTLRYIFDTMSGPSPNGLPKLKTAQTVTTP